MCGVILFLIINKLYNVHSESFHFYCSSILSYLISILYTQYSANVLSAFFMHAMYAYSTCLACYAVHYVCIFNMSNL